MKLVIAPNIRQFDRFVYEERCRLSDTREPIEYRFVSREDQLRGYRGEIIIVNSDQLSDDGLLRYAQYHDDKHCPIRYVEL